MPGHTLYTAGYAAFFRPEELIAALQEQEIGAVVDVRAFPDFTSLRHYRGKNLGPELRKNGIHYLSFAQEFGVRPQQPEFYTDGHVDFDKIARSTMFRTGCERLANGLGKFNVCLLCAEKDPSVCHRSILITRQYEKLYPDTPIRHITAAGLLSQKDIDEAVRKRYALFSDSLAECYRMQATQIAWRPEPGSSGRMTD